MRLRFFLPLAAAVAVGACSGRPSTVAVSPADVTAAIASRNDPAQAAVVEAMNRFALDFYAFARGSADDAVYSPASIAIAGSMLEPGARGETADEIARALHVAQPGEAHDRAVAAVLARLPTANAAEAPVLRIANRLFSQKDFALRDAFLDVTSHDYGAPAEPVDFVSAPDAARREINAWVDGVTKHKIADLLPEGAIDPSTRLVLVNAMYFMGRWRLPFDATRAEPFERLDGTRAQVQMMRHDDGGKLLQYATFAGGQIAELPYEGTSVVMDIVLPEGPRGLLALERDPAVAYRALFGLQARVVSVRLPKFRVETSIDLKRGLQALGVRDAFDPARADLSGIAGAPHDLFVGAALHRAFVHVDERGTEAAAATAIMAELAGLVTISRPQPIPFVVDHPFMFFIRDRASGLLLFVGRVAQPT